MKQHSDIEFESDNNYALWSTGHALDEDSGVRVPYILGNNRGEQELKGAEEPKETKDVPPL